MPSPADQLPTDVGSLARKVAGLERQVRELRASRRLANAAIDGGALMIRDTNGSLRAIVGEQADGSSGVNIVNGEPPPTPAAPTVTPGLASLAVTWNGLFTDATNAPLDWSRTEVHVGTTSAFEPDQVTLRATIETAQGGTVVLPLPYSEWWVRLRSRTLAGVAGPSSVAVAGTPRLADASDIAADAITGKVVTGGIVQTATSGKRVVVTPNGGFDGTIPATRFYSGKAGEQRPGEISATLDPDFAGPYLALTAPSISTDWKQAATLRLHSGTFNSSEVAQWELTTPFTGHDSTVSIRGVAPTSVMPGSGAYALTEVVNVDGSWGEFAVKSTGFECNPDSGDLLTYNNGVLTVPSERFGRVTITPAGDGVVTSMQVSGLDMPGTNFYGFVAARTTVPGDRKPASPVGTLKGVTGVSCAGETSDGMTVYVNRQNATDTIVNWWIKGE